MTRIGRFIIETTVACYCEAENIRVGDLIELDPQSVYRVKAVATNPDQHSVSITYHDDETVVYDEKSRLHVRATNL